jgi:hypothetical protein
MKKFIYWLFNVDGDGDVQIMLMLTTAIILAALLIFLSE